MDREKQLQELFHEWQEVHRLIGPGEQERKKQTATFPECRKGPCVCLSTKK